MFCSPDDQSGCVLWTLRIMSLPRLPLAVLALAGAASLAPLSQAHAAAVFDSGVEVAEIDRLDRSDVGDYALINSFEVSESVDISTVSFIGSATGGQPTEFTVTVHADNGADRPVAAATATRSASSYTAQDTGADLAGADLFSYTLSFSGADVIALGAGTWWISIFASATPGTWAWGADSTVVRQTYFRNATQPEGIWGDYDDVALAFSVGDDTPTTPIPAPAALPLLAAGLASLALAGRRRG